MKPYYLVVFESKNHAVLLYTLLESKGDNSSQLVSTPCYLKVGCSYSLKVNNRSCLKGIIDEAEGNHIKKFKIYYLEKKDGKNHYHIVDINSL